MFTVSFHFIQTRTVCLLNVIKRTSLCVYSRSCICTWPYVWEHLLHVLTKPDLYYILYSTSPIQNICLSVFLTDRIVIHLSIDYDEKFDGLRTTCAVSIETVASLQDNSPAELGLRGCKNWPAPFPGRMSYVRICVVSCPCVISYPTIMARYSLFVLKVPLNPKQPTNLAHSTVEFLHEETHGVCVCMCWC